MALNYNSFQAGSDAAVFFIDGNGNLQFMPLTPPTGFSSLEPITIDNFVFSFMVPFFSPPTANNLGSMLVYSREPATLSLQSPEDFNNDSAEQSYIPVDRDVSFLPASFQTAFQTNLAAVFVLGLDGNLWREHPPFGQVPPKREQVDGNVVAFQALSDTDVFVLGSDGNLWHEHAPFGQAPPKREPVDGNVALPLPVADGEIPVLRSFQALSDTEVLVLHSDGNLWLEHGPFGQLHLPPRQVDGNVIAFQALSDTDVFVLGRNGNLWHEHAPFGQAPPKREPVDGNVVAFQALSDMEVFVQSSDGNLWLERGPFGNPAQPPPVLAASNVRFPLIL
jgi:hypothetical protein